MKVISNLTRIGVISARRGPGGGICLNRAPEDIHLDEIIANTEKHLQDLQTAGLPRGEQPQCSARLNGCLQEALQAYLDVLAGFTLADILENRKEVADLLEVGEKAA